MAEKLIGFIKRFKLGRKQIIVISIGVFSILMVLTITVRVLGSKDSNSESNGEYSSEAQAEAQSDTSNEHQEKADKKKLILASEEDEKGQKRVLYIETISDPSLQKGSVNASTQTEIDIQYRIQNDIVQNNSTSNTRPGYDIDVTNNPDMDPEATVSEIVFEQYKEAEEVTETE